MSLSLPIPVLKSRARRLRRTHGIALHEALDRVAAAEGYSSWSLLVARRSGTSRFPPGTLCLIGARPGEGKTRFATSLLIDALRAGRPGWFFALHNDRSLLRDHFEHHGADFDTLGRRLFAEADDDIDADHIVAQVAGRAHEGSIVVVDYLQVLDQRRSAPSLDTQLTALSRLARTTGATLLLLAQIHRAFVASGRSMPGPDDIRQLNPMDLSVFDRMLFLHQGRQHLELPDRAKSRGRA